MVSELLLDLLAVALFPRLLAQSCGPWMRGADLLEEPGHGHL